MDVDGIFTSRGVIPTNSKFWEMYAEDLVTEDGITSGFKRLLGESLFAPMKGIQTPFYDNFIGKFIDYGAQWKENIMKLPGVKKFNPKATAQDAFGYEETEGFEALHETHINGWERLTIPTEFELAEMVNDPSRISEFASFIQSNGAKVMKMTVDSQIGKKLVSTTTNEITADFSDFSGLRKIIRDTATEMRKNTGTYVEPAVDASNYLTAAPEVVAIMTEELLNDLVADTAALPSPDKLINNCRIITVPQMPEPLTEAEYNAGVISNGWDIKPSVAFGSDVPKVIMMSTERIVYRPYKRMNKVNINNNGAGDFTNTHIIFKGSIGVRPWENAVRINDGDVGNSDGGTGTE